MASVRMIIAKRGNPSLLGSLKGCRPILRGYCSRLFDIMAMTVNPSRSRPSRPMTLLGSASSRNILHPCISNVFPLDLTARAFGRKASRMGHHIQNLKDMAHEGSREEARQRREEKKKKSKKARLKSLVDDPTEGKGGHGEDIDGNGLAGGNNERDPRGDGHDKPLLPEPSVVRSGMLGVVASLERSFSSIRGGEATPELFDSVRVSAYGEKVPLSSVGQVVMEDSQRATISCYDPSVVGDVRDAVRDMQGMSLNPYIEEGGSGVIIVPIPRASEETRREMVKELGRQAENGRRRVRDIRRRAMDIITKGKQGKLEGISKDYAFRTGKDIDSVTEDVLSILDEIVGKKQRSVMED